MELQIPYLKGADCNQHQLGSTTNKFKSAQDGFDAFIEIWFSSRKIGGQFLTFFWHTYLRMILEAGIANSPSVTPGWNIRGSGVYIL
jgi:hypothetical protein